MIFFNSLICIAKTHKKVRRLSSDDSDEDARSLPCPAQDKIKKQISILESEINAAVTARDSGLADAKVQSKIQKLREELCSKKKELKTKVNKARLAKKYRSEKQESINALVNRNPDAGKTLKVGPVFFNRFMCCSYYKCE